MQKLNKAQKTRVEFLINSNSVSGWDKTLLIGIKGNDYKNISSADNILLVEIFLRYWCLK